MYERRVENRRLLTYFSRVFNRNNSRLLGYLADITTGGFMLIGDVPIKIDSILPLRIDLPENYGENEHLDFDAKVVWIRPDRDPELFRIGLKLLEINPKVLLILEQLINDYGLVKMA
jgi:PilZ domain